MQNNNDVVFQIMLIVGTLLEYIILTYYSKPNKIGAARIKLIYRSGVLKLILFPLLILSSLLVGQYGLFLVGTITSIINFISYKNFIKQYNNGTTNIKN